MRISIQQSSLILIKPEKDINNSLLASEKENEIMNSVILFISDIKKLNDHKEKKLVNPLNF